MAHNGVAYLVLLKSSVCLSESEPQLSFLACPSPISTTPNDYLPSVFSATPIWAPVTDSA